MDRMRLGLRLTFIILMCTVTGAAGPETSAGDPGEDWRRWRGARGDGTWRGPRIAERWPQEGLQRLWTQQIGSGYAGVVSTGSRTITMDRQSEPQPSERVVCFSFEDGTPLWTHADHVEYGDLEYGNGPRAAPTVDRGLVFTVGALGQVNCLKLATGERVWSTHLVQRLGGRLPTWGYAASPLIIDELVVLLAGGTNQRSVVALDRQTGRTMWTSLSDEAAYATPIVLTRQSRRQLIVWTPSHIRSLEPGTGRLLWSEPYKVTMGVSIATPMIHADIVLVSGYWEGARALQLGRRPNKAKLIWEENRFLRGLMSQPLGRDGFAYLLDKQHGLTCFEIQTGRKIWDDENRLTPRGRNPQASIIWLDEGPRVLALNSDGELVLATLSPHGYQEHARAKIVGPTWAHPAYCRDRIIARTDTELVCVQLPIVEE